ncbi:dockerin type I repeat-containing protein [bacterium AH-315-J21]|nr:dockerin type I repeat-containing protein [bacterium AH-315-J21]
MSNYTTRQHCFTNVLVSIFMGLLVTSMSLSNAIARTPGHYYIYVHNGQEGSRDQLRSQVSQFGGQLRHTLSDSEFVVVLPQGVAKNLHSDATRNVFVQTLTGAKILPDSSQRREFIDLQRPNTAGARAWDIFRAKRVPGETSPIVLPSDSVNLFPSVARTTTALIPTDESGPFRTSLTSLYLIGEVAVALVLMESDGSQFNWTSAQEDTALSRVMGDLDELTFQASESGVDLSWVYEVDRSVPTPSEPINEAISGASDLKWIDDALSFLGFSSGFNGTQQFAASLRTTHKTDWAFAIFVALDDPGAASFPSGESAFVMVKDEDVISPFVISEFGKLGNRITHHELSHVFGAMDEGGGKGACQDTENVCENRFGYLQYVNGNCTICKPSPDPCVMEFAPLKVYCQWSKGQVGWVDSDGDGAPDPIDPNSGVWMSLSPVQPGNNITITTITGALVATFNITENNFDDELPGGGFALWDGKNFDNVTAAVGTYNYVVAGGSIQTGSLVPGNPSIKPLPNSAGYSFDDILRFKLGNSFARITVELLDNTGALFSRPVWNKLMGSSTSLIRTVDLSLIPNGQYTAKFTAWRPDGGLSDPYSIQFIQYTCGDANNDGNFNIADVTHLIAHIFSALPIDDPIERADADGNGAVNVTDVNYMVTRIFQGGPAPICSGVQQ